MKYTFKEIMSDTVDLHIHAGPSVANRSVDAYEMYTLAQDAGYRAIVIKDHYFPSVLGTTMLSKHEGNGKTQVFGSCCLNNATGGLNPFAVDVSIAMGAKIIWFPTLSSRRHIENHTGKFIGAGNLSLTENPLSITDENGVLKSSVIEILKILIAHPNVVLATGHLSAVEIDVLVPKALEMGVKKVMITHPHQIVDATLENVCRWCEMGAFVEINGGVFQGVSKSPLNPNIPRKWISDYLKNIDKRKIIIVSDSGQAGSPDPVKVLYTFLNLLIEEDQVPLDVINQLVKENPARLIDLQ